MPAASFLRRLTVASFGIIAITAAAIDPAWAEPGPGVEGRMESRGFERRGVERRGTENRGVERQGRFRRFIGGIFHRGRNRSAERSESRRGVFGRIGKSLKNNWEKLAIGALTVKAFGPQLKAIGQGILGLGAKAVEIAGPHVQAAAHWAGTVAAPAVAHFATNPVTLGVGAGVLGGAIVAHKTGVVDKIGRRLGRSRIGALRKVGNWLTKGEVYVNVDKIGDLAKRGGVRETKMPDGSKLLVARDHASGKLKYFKVEAKTERVTLDTGKGRAETINKGTMKEISKEQYFKLHRAGSMERSSGFRSFANRERSALNEMGHGLERQQRDRARERNAVEARAETPQPQREITPATGADVANFLKEAGYERQDRAPDPAASSVNSNEFAKVAGSDVVDLIPDATDRAGAGNSAGNTERTVAAKELRARDAKNFGVRSGEIKEHTAWRYIRRAMKDKVGVDSGDTRLVKNSFKVVENHVDPQTGAVYFEAKVKHEGKVRQLSGFIQMDKGGNRPTGLDRIVTMSLY